MKDLDTAKEIVHDAFIGLWDKRAQIDLNKSYKSYLSASIYNKCINHLRDNKKFNWDILILEHLHSETEYHNNDHLVEAELAVKIQNAIDELPEKCREVFMLQRFESLKYLEIADRLGISVKTVEAQMSKALQHLRERLKDYLCIILIIHELWLL